MCGPSGAQQSIATSQQNFFNELQASYATNFGQQQAILSSLNSALEPILQAGPNQPGFSAAENAALTGGAINATAAQARNAQTIAGASAGGNTGVTTGGQKQLQAEIGSEAGQNLAGQENRINLANYATGRQNFFNAESALSGIGAMYNPTGYAGAATSAGNTAFNSATTVQNMRNQEQADIGGAVSGLAGMALGGFGNLDTTGGSTTGEQVANFFEGMA
jgi:type VI protein secretion system component VasK